MARILYFDPDLVAFNRLRQILGSRDGHTCEASQKEFGDSSLNSKEVHEVLYCDSWTKFETVIREQALDIVLIGTERVLKGTPEQSASVQDLKVAGGDKRIPVVLVDHTVDKKKLVSVFKLRVEDFWIKPYDEPLIIQKFDLIFLGEDVESQVFNFSTKSRTHLVFDAEISSMGAMGLTARLRKPIKSGEMVVFHLKTTSEERIFQIDIDFEARCLQSVPIPNNPIYKHQGLFATWGINTEKFPRFRLMGNAMRRNVSLGPLSDSLNRACKLFDVLETKIAAFYKTGQSEQKDLYADLSAKRPVWKKKTSDFRQKLKQLGTQLDNAAWDSVKIDVQQQFVDFEKEINEALVAVIRGKSK